MASAVCVCVRSCASVKKKEMDTCAGLYLRPLRCGSPPPRPACLAQWPPGLLRNQTAAPAQYTASCKCKHGFMTSHDSLYRLTNIQSCSNCKLWNGDITPFQWTHPRLNYNSCVLYSYYPDNLDISCQTKPSQSEVYHRRDFVYNNISDMFVWQKKTPWQKNKQTKNPQGHALLWLTGLQSVTFIRFSKSTYITFP